ncbi:MAG: hypothetical protein Q4Q22_04810 [Methanosphaera sp.]|nr:hypothetical protein [Methanosphaera sp.]
MNDYIMLYILTICIFLVIAMILKHIYKRLKYSEEHVLKLEEYLPTEEIQTLKQVFFLAMMTLFVINIFYQLVAQGNDIIYFSALDIILSLITIAYIKINDLKSVVLTLAMIPFVSIDYMVLDSGDTLYLILFMVHLVALLYVAWFFYQQFKRYTKAQGLSYTILLLFGIVFISFILTSIVEDVNLLDSLVMVSNAFTSNGYAILGHTIIGKLNEIFLVWSGYVLSGVGTATLTVTLMARHYNKRFDELERLIKELKDEKEQ